VELPALSAEERHRLRQGLPVQRQMRHGHQGSGFVAIDVQAPTSCILRLLTVFEDYPAMIPVVKKAVVHVRSHDQSGATTARCHYRISRFQLGVSVVHSVDPAAGLVRFDLDKGSPGVFLQEVSGFWHVQPEPDGRDGFSRVWLKVDDLRASGWVPCWLVDYASERALRRATAWLKPQAEALRAAEEPAGPSGRHLRLAVEEPASRRVHG
jgi:hypothetical protein